MFAENIPRISLKRIGTFAAMFDYKHFSHNNFLGLPPLGFVRTLRAPVKLNFQFRDPKMVSLRCESQLIVEIPLPKTLSKDLNDRLSGDAVVVAGFITSWFTHLPFWFILIYPFAFVNLTGMFVGYFRDPGLLSFHGATFWAPEVFNLPHPT